MSRDHPAETYLLSLFDENVLQGEGGSVRKHKESTIYERVSLANRMD
jgi:hypothetical protein